MASGVEDSGFRGDGGFGFFRELVTRIADWLAGKMVVGEVLFDALWSFGGVGIDEPEPNSAVLKFGGDAPEFRGIAIGDRAIGADKEEDSRGGRRNEGVDGFASEIDGICVDHGCKKENGEHE